MKLILSLLGVGLGLETANQPEVIKRERRSIDECNEIRGMCSNDVNDGIYDNMADCMSEMDFNNDCGGADASASQCQDYKMDGFNLSCPPGLDADHFWPMVRPDLAPKGPRPLAPKEQCINGCDLAEEVDQFACSYFQRVQNLHQLFEELEEFLESDLEEIIEFKRQFVRRYREVTKKTRSMDKMQLIQQTIGEVVDTVQDNERLIAQLDGEIGNIEAEISTVELELTNLHQFCKVGKDCAKQCYFGPEDFGGKPLRDCAEYYNHNFWSKPSNPTEWYGKPQSGVYLIQPRPDLKPKMVYCDQKTDGGGWTVIQHKGISNSSLWEQYSAPIDDPDAPNQYQANWAQPMSGYKNGFGWVSCNGEADYWMGLDYMNALTMGAASGNVKLRIDIKDWDNRDYWGYYNTFVIRDERSDYRMTARGYDGVGSYSIGDAWDGMAFEGNAKNKRYTRSNGMKFSTKDVDNDRFCYYTRTIRNNYGMELPKYNADDKAARCEDAAAAAGRDWKTDKTLASWGSCAGQDGSGFWYNRCSAGNVNGKVYFNGENGYYQLKELAIENEFTHESIMRDHDDGMIWGTLNKGRDYSFMLSEMRVRPQNFVTKAGDITRTRLNGTPMDDERAEDNSNNQGRRG